MDRPRWIADEMVGRLARYLRFVGHDTEYVRGLPDDEIAARAVRETRRLITRDRALARRVSGSVLVESTRIDEQIRAVRAAAPEAPFDLAFDRCTLCNGQLVPWSAPPEGSWPPGVPRERVEGGLRVFACASCGHRYWEGTHTAHVRADLARWLSGTPG